MFKISTRAIAAQVSSFGKTVAIQYITMLILIKATPLSSLMYHFTYAG